MHLASIIGYLATFFVIMSFVMKDIRWLRIISIIGCVLFVVDAYFINSIPVALTNGIVALINAVHLYKLYHPKPNQEKATKE